MNSPGHLTRSLSPTPAVATAPDRLVSVVISVYNRLQYLRQAVGSVLGQTYPHVELIVVDDGSETDFDPVLAPFGSRVTLLRKTNGGPASARNFGLAQARGQFVLFVDDDDFLEPNAIDVLRNMIDQYPRAAWSAGRFAYVDESGQVLPRQHRQRIISGDIYDDMIRRNVIGGPCVVLARTQAVREAGGFDESPSLKFAEDYDLWLTLARISPIAATAQVVSNYRLYPGQATQNWARHFAALVQVLEKHRACARPGHEALFDQALAQLRWNHGDDLYVSGYPAQAREQWRMSAAGRSDRRRWPLYQRLAKSYVPSTLVKLCRAVAGRSRGQLRNLEIS